MREISLFVTFFVFFVSSPRLQVATVDRFSRSIRQRTRFHTRKCLLGVSMMNFHIYPICPPKFENLHYGLRQLRTAITRPFLKIDARCLHQSWGVFGVGQFNGVVKICPRPTLVTMVTNGWFSNRKLAKTQLIQEIELRILHQRGFSRSSNLMVLLKYTGWAKKSKPGNFFNNFVYCQPIFIIFGTYTL